MSGDSEPCKVEPGFEPEELECSGIDLKCSQQLTFGLWLPSWWHNLGDVGGSLGGGARLEEAGH